MPIRQQVIYSPIHSFMHPVALTPWWPFGVRCLPIRP